MEFLVTQVRALHDWGTMDRLIPETLDKFHELLEYNTKQRRWKGLILTGSEITLGGIYGTRTPGVAGGYEESDSDARHAPGQESFTRKLVEAGVNEFLSASATRREVMTESPRFPTRLRNHAGHGASEQYEDVVSITNTVSQRRIFVCCLQWWSAWRICEI